MADPTEVSAHLVGIWSGPRSEVHPTSDGDRDLGNPALTCATEAAAMPTFAKDTVGADLQYTKANPR